MFDAIFPKVLFSDYFVIVLSKTSYKLDILTCTYNHCQDVFKLHNFLRGIRQQTVPWLEYILLILLSVGG